jgi:hypothetical protein
VCARAKKAAAEQAAIAARDKLLRPVVKSALSATGRGFGGRPRGRAAPRGERSSAGPVVLPKIVGRIDRREMQENLRKIAALAPVRRMVFLGRQPRVSGRVSGTRSYLQYVFDLRRDSEFASLGITRDCVRRRALI